MVIAVDLEAALEVVSAADKRAGLLSDFFGNCSRGAKLGVFFTKIVTDFSCSILLVVVAFIPLSFHPCCKTLHFWTLIRDEEFPVLIVVLRNQNLRKVRGNKQTAHSALLNFYIFFFLKAALGIYRFNLGRLAAFYSQD